jgi:hypothetical protein
MKLIKLKPNGVEYIKAFRLRADNRDAQQSV